MHGERIIYIHVLSQQWTQPIPPHAILLYQYEFSVFVHVHACI